MNITDHPLSKNHNIIIFVMFLVNSKTFRTGTVFFNDMLFFPVALRICMKDWLQFGKGTVSPVYSCIKLCGGIVLGGDT